MTNIFAGHDGRDKVRDWYVFGKDSTSKRTQQGLVRRVLTGKTLQFLTGMSHQVLPCELQLD